MVFANRAGDVSEALDHHPEIRVSYGKVVIATWTHSVSGLSKKDFELAKKIDALASQNKSGRRAGARRP